MSTRTLLSIDEFERLPEPEPLKTLRKGDFLKDDIILPGLSISVSTIFEPVI